MLFWLTIYILVKNVVNILFSVCMKSCVILLFFLYNLFTFWMLLSVFSIIALLPSCSSSEAVSHQSCSSKIGVLKNFTKFKGKHLCWTLFFNKVASLSPATLRKRGSNTDVFQWILWNFYDKLFYKTSTGDCFFLLDNQRKLHIAFAQLLFNWLI